MTRHNKVWLALILIGWASALAAAAALDGYRRAWAPAWIIDTDPAIQNGDLGIE